MRYCNQCHRITIGEPLFCNFCGSSYDVKLCPHRHINPRSAEICSQCGSRDLSTPAPRASIFTGAMISILSIFPGIILLLLSIMVLVGLFEAVLNNQQIQMQLVVIILLLSILWYAYMHLPSFIKRMLRSLWKTKKDRHS